MQVLASQLHFLANKNADLAIPPLFWPVNCIKIGGHVALLSDPTVYSLYCASEGVVSKTCLMNMVFTGTIHIFYSIIKAAIECYIWTCLWFQELHQFRRRI